MAPERQREKRPGPRERSEEGSRPARRGLWLLGLFALGAAYLGARRRPTAPQRVAEPVPGSQPESPAEPRPGYERKDANVAWIFGVVAMLAVSGILIHFLLAGWLTRLNERPAPADAWQPVTRPAGGLVAPTMTFPRLQVSPPFDLQRFRAREEARLNSYGWVDRAAGTAHIPIREAMDRVLQQGLPVRPQAGAAPEKPGPSSYELQLQRVQKEAR